MQIRNKTIALSAAGLLAVGTATGWSAQAILQRPGATAPAAASPSVPDAPLPPAIVPNYRAIVARNQAAVVGITTAGMMHTAMRPDSDNPGNDEDSPFPQDSPFSQFFRGMQVPRAQMVHAQGSGFIVSPDGLVLTNAHVVDGAKEVTVKLSDHHEYKARVLGADRASDIALLKIDARDLPTVQLGNSDQLAVGDYVLAIGEPFGLEETATAGIVSAKGRSLPGDGYVPFIQTDAAVNPGNSGGPLFDSSGKVVGINAQIYSNSGGYQGVAFAIPINVAVQIKDQIVKTGKVLHGRLGVEVQTLNQSLARSFHLQSPNGALIAQVQPDSAAARAGIKVGDVILKFNGTAVIDAGDLSARVGSSAPGDDVSLELWREGNALTLNAKIGSASGEEVAKADAAPASDHARLGLSVRPLTQDERTEAGISGGLIVEDAQGPAAVAGIQSGDVLLSVDGTPVQSVQQLRKLVDEHSKEVALLIQRGHSHIFVPVELG
jgi:serine protease Do